MTPADIVARLRARATSEDVTEDRWRPRRPSYGGDRYQDELHAYAAEVLREEADAIERESGPSLPDPPLTRETAMRVAEAVRDTCALAEEGFGPMKLRYGDASRSVNCGVVVDRILGPASEVERAEREVVEAAEYAWERFEANDHGQAWARCMDAVGHLRAARERAGQ